MVVQLHYGSLSAAPTVAFLGVVFGLCERGVAERGLNVVNGYVGIG